MTTTEQAAALRAEYKRLGLTSRDVSVRAEYFSLGSSINVMVKTVKNTPQPVAPEERTMTRQAKNRLFACDCAEHVLWIFERSYPGDDRPRRAIEVSRRFAVGSATQQELAVARVAAIAAAGDAARNSDRAAAWDAAWAAAGAAAADATGWDAAADAAGAVAGSAAWHAARDASRTRDPAWAAAGDAAADAAWDAAGDAAADSTRSAERDWQRTLARRYRVVLNVLKRDARNAFTRNLNPGESA